MNTTYLTNVMNLFLAQRKSASLATCEQHKELCMLNFNFMQVWYLHDV